MKRILLETAPVPQLLTSSFYLLPSMNALAGQSDWTYGPDFSPDGRTFAAGRQDGTLQIYEVGRAIR